MSKTVKNQNSELLNWSKLQFLVFQNDQNCFPHWVNSEPPKLSKCYFLIFDELLHFLKAGIDQINKITAPLIAKKAFLDNLRIVKLPFLQF